MGPPQHRQRHPDRERGCRRRPRLTAGPGVLNSGAPARKVSRVGDEPGRPRATATDADKFPGRTRCERILYPAQLASGSRGLCRQGLGIAIELSRVPPRAIG